VNDKSVRGGGDPQPSATDLNCTRPGALNKKRAIEGADRARAVIQECANAQTVYRPGPRGFP